MILTAADLAGVTMIAGATLAGAWLGRRFARLRTISLALAAVALVTVVAADLLPDIWGDLRETGLAWWIAAVALVAGLAGTDAIVRHGCTCGPGPAGGRATAAALGLHRALEGAVLAIAGSAAVIVALVLHAASEGFALTTLLAGERRARAAALLAVTCLSPAAGATVLALVHLPEPAAPVMTAVVAGVLLRAALAAWQLRPRPARASTAGLDMANEYHSGVTVRQ
jgi:zinc transporter ZupT